MRRVAGMIAEGVTVATHLGRLPTFTEYGDCRRELGLHYSEWQIYRELGGHKGAWSAFQYLIIEASATATAGRVHAASP